MTTQLKQKPSQKAESLEDKIARLSAIYERTEEKIIIQKKKHAQLTELAKEEINKLEDDKKALKAELESVNGEIDERKDYLKGQELVIQEAVQMGNDSLQDIQETYKKFLVKKDDELSQLSIIQDQIAQSNEDLTSLVLQKKNMEMVYDKTSENYKNTLSSLRIEVEKLTDTYKNMKSQVDAWSTKIADENRALDEEKASLASQTEKVREEQRYLESRKSLI